MIEYFPEPVERKPMGECVECEKYLFEGDTVVHINVDFICKECSVKTALEDADKSEFQDYIREIDKKDDFAEWYYNDFFVTL